MVTEPRNSPIDALLGMVSTTRRPQQMPVLLTARTWHILLGSKSRSSNLTVMYWIQNNN